MSEILFGIEYLKELEAEAMATRKCLERVPEGLSDWKPHEKSMKMGDLSLLVAEIPKWITLMIEKSEIDFATHTVHSGTIFLPHSGPMLEPVPANLYSPDRNFSGFK